MGLGGIFSRKVSLGNLVWPGGWTFDQPKLQQFKFSGCVRVRRWGVGGRRGIVEVLN